MANYIQVPFGTDGDLIPIPVGVQPTGAVSFTQGFGPNYELPDDDPSSLDVPRAQTNQLYNLITTVLQQYQQIGTPDFIDSSETIDSNPFPYAQYARVIYGGVVYQSLVAANTDTPPSSNWAIVNPVNSGIATALHTGSAYAPVTADIGTLVERSNSGGAMADTLPGSVSPLAAAWFAYFKNVDVSANDTVGVGSGGTIKVGSDISSNFFVMKPGETYLVISQGTGNYTAFLISTAQRPLLPANNLSDLASLATALTNLGFGGNNTSHFQIPNANDPTKPWIVQFGTSTTSGAGQVTVTLPVTYPNSCVLALASDLQGPPPSFYVCAQVLSTSQISVGAANNGGPVAASVQWLTIGN